MFFHGILFWAVLRLNFKSSLALIEPCPIKKNPLYRCVPLESCHRIQELLTPCGPDNIGVCCQSISPMSPPGCGIRNYAEVQVQKRPTGINKDLELWLRKLIKLRIISADTDKYSVNLFHVPSLPIKIPKSYDNGRYVVYPYRANENSNLPAESDEINHSYRSDISKNEEPGVSGTQTANVNVLPTKRKERDISFSQRNSGESTKLSPKEKVNFKDGINTEQPKAGYKNDSFLHLRVRSVLNEDMVSRNNGSSFHTLLRNGNKHDLSLQVPTESSKDTVGTWPPMKHGPHHVIGGFPETDPWPWMASIFEYHTGKYICGGSVIHPMFILTAAHCFSILDLSTKTYKVQVNQLKRINDDEYSYVQKIIVHEGFVRSCFCNDVALLKLEELLDSSVTPICLPDIDVAHPGDKVTIIGFGSTSYRGKNSINLRRADDLTIFTDSECKRMFRRFFNGSIPYDFSIQHICAGAWDGSKDSCGGDSGGPLLHEDYDGIYSQIGIVSFGIGCGEPGFSGVYSRVSFFLPWITQKMAT